MNHQLRNRVIKFISNIDDESCVFEAGCWKLETGLRSWMLKVRKYIYPSFYF
jgi:hypothetical protein